MTSKVAWWDRIPTWIQRSLAITGLVSAPLSLWLGLRELLNLRGPGWSVVLATFNAALVLVALAAVYVQQYRHHEALETERAALRRDSAVAVALPNLHAAYHHLRDAAVMIRNGDGEFAYRAAIARSLGHMTQVFSVVTGAPCRMVIKELLATADAPDNFDFDERFFTVRTFVRHTGTYSGPTDGPSPLHLNSDFLQVFDPMQDKRCFFSNDLDAEVNYANPHRRGDPSTFDYSSTIVWPIQREKSHDVVGIIGFLCVDSKQKGVFRYANDFDLGAAYADTLYTVLSMREGGAQSKAASATNDEG